jgi:parvulin-like peptidyl-prolyl isomerase
MRRRIAGETAQLNAIETWLNAQRHAANAPDEKMARAWFGRHQPEFRIPEQANVSHIFLTIHDVRRPDRTTEINEISRRLIAGEATFAALASQYSEDERSKKAGGALGWLTRNRLPEEFANQIFSASIGRPSTPFRTSLGWHIILVHERKAARQPAFAEVKDEIMARLDQPWREQAVKQLLQSLRDKAGLNINTAVLEHTVPAPEGS